MIKYTQLKQDLDNVNNKMIQQYIQTKLLPRKIQFNQSNRLNPRKVATFIKNNINKFLITKGFNRFIFEDYPLTQTYTQEFLLYGNINKQLKIDTTKMQYQLTNLQQKQLWSKEYTEYPILNNNINEDFITIKPFIIDVKNITSIDNIQVKDNIRNIVYNYKLIPNISNVNKTIINQVIPDYYSKIQERFDMFKQTLTNNQFNVLKQLPCYKGSYNLDFIKKQLNNNNITIKQYTLYNKLNQALKNKDKKVKKYIHTIRRNRFINPRYLTIFYRISIANNLTIYYTPLQPELVDQLLDLDSMDKMSKSDRKVLTTFSKIIALQELLDKYDIVNRSLLVDIQQVKYLIEQVGKDVYLQSFNYSQLMDFNNLQLNNNKVYLVRGVTNITKQSIIPLCYYQPETYNVYYNKAKTGILHLFKKQIIIKGLYPDLHYLQNYIIDDKLAINDISYARMIIAVLLNERNIDLKYFKITKKNYDLKVYNTYNKLITKRVQDYDCLLQYKQVDILNKVVEIENDFKNIRDSYNKRYLKDMILRYAIIDVFLAKKNTTIMKKLMNNNDFVKYYRMFLRTKVILQYLPHLKHMINECYQKDMNCLYNNQKESLKSKYQQILKLQAMKISDIIKTQLDVKLKLLQQEKNTIDNNISQIKPNTFIMKIDVLQQLYKWIDFIKTGDNRYTVSKEPTILITVLKLIAFQKVIQEFKNTVLLENILALDIQLDDSYNVKINFSKNQLITLLKIDDNNLYLNMLLDEAYKRCTRVNIKIIGDKALINF